MLGVSLSLILLAAPALEGEVLRSADSAAVVSPRDRSDSSRDAKSLMGQGLQYLQQARYESAIEAFRRALDLDPTLAIAQYDLGVAYFSLNRFDEARKALEEVRRRNPDHRFAAYFLARLDLVQDNLAKAIQGFQSLSEKDPVADELYYLGSAYFRKGDMQQAVLVLQKAAALKPNDYRVPLLLARAYRKTGQSEQADRQAALSENLRDSYRRKSREI